MEVRLWHEFARYVAIAAKTTEGGILLAPAFLCEHSRNECPDLQVDNDGLEVTRNLVRRPSTVDQHFGDLRFLPIALRASNFLI